ncbi:hypothetical protein ACFLS9_08475 [Bacteroidota bacterium]
MFNCKLICIIYFTIHIFLIAQQYPEWFLHQGKISCNELSVGYSKPGYYKDSVISYAFRNGCFNYVVNECLRIKGGQAFLTLETGTYWMGAKFEEYFDTALVDQSASKLGIIDTFSSANIVAVLLSSRDCELKEIYKKRSRVSVLPTPGWINELPTDTGYLFAVGFSPEYFYETSSWMEAERIARLNLARQILINIKSLQKMTNTDYQDLTNEEFFATLNNVSVIARWVDLKRKIYYVLLKMPY